MKRFILSDHAELDLQDIFDQTVDLFGHRQAVLLHLQFAEAFERLGMFPLSGHTRDDLIDPAQSIRFLAVSKRFLILYRPETMPVEIVRVVDGITDIGRLLIVE